MLALIFALSLHVNAQETIWDVKAAKFISLDEIRGAAGEIFVVGEQHAVAGDEQDPETITHHSNKTRLIRQLQKQSDVSVGMEFLIYTFQDFVNRFVSGVLPETDFLREVGWSSKNPFQFYRDQILAVRGTAGETIALNIPRNISSQVSKDGKDSLSPDQRALLPPIWERGNDAYFERFSEQMKDHATPEKIERYFWAQSLWDATMTWQALEHRKRMPNDVLVIIVGEFHVRYGGGLPSEFQKQGASVKTVVQAAITDWTPSNLQDAIAADPKYGEIADYIWIHKSSQPRKPPHALADRFIGM